MKRGWLVSMVLAGTLLLGKAGGAAQGTASRPELQHRWLFVNMAFLPPGSTWEGLVKRAAEAGYNAIVVDWDEVWPDTADLKAAAAKHHMEIIPKLMNWKMGMAPNLVEGLPVKEARFVVHDGEATLEPDPAVSLPDGGFEQAEGDRFTGWEVQRPGVFTFCDHSAHHGGQASVRIENPKKEKSEAGFFIGKRVKVSPYREYRVTVWGRTVDKEATQVGINVRGKARPCTAPTGYREQTGELGRNVRGEGPNSGALVFAEDNTQRTQTWQKLAVIFNSLDNTEVTISFGGWDLTSGAIWFDDAKIEEVGLLDVLRRPGTPVVVKGEEGTVYEEGRDYNRISDPLLGNYLDRDAPMIQLTETSRISEGQRLRVSYYHYAQIYYWAPWCLSDPKVFEAFRRQAKWVNEELHPKTVFLQHDEIWSANWCETCQSRHETPGQLLAEHFRKCVQLVKEDIPDAKLWVWSDMFDPFQNAHEDYYLANGTYAGSWEGVPADVGIANWAGHLNGKNVHWFAARGHEQILCGYYDDRKNDVHGEKMRAWLKTAEGEPGIVGAMYTTWRCDFDNISTWAAGVWGSAPSASRK